MDPLTIGIMAFIFSLTVSAMKSDDTNKDKIQTSQIEETVKDPSWK